MHILGTGDISGSTAAEIVDSVRDLISRDQLRAGSSLPAIRELAVALRINRNTVAAAYRLLVAAGVAETRGRAGTVVIGAPVLAREGLLATEPLRNLASGNPDPAFLPDPQRVLQRLGYQSRLYGAPTIDADLSDWAHQRLFADVDRDFRLVLAHGAVDAVERLLMAHLTRGDLVAVEDPCFVSSIGTLRLNGLRARPVETDESGMDPAELDMALREGARAVLLTPRAHNPTGASLSEQRAAELRSVLERYPNVLVIEDDHFSALSAVAYHCATPQSTNRWALVRSVSKFLGPDLRLAFVATDPHTAEHLESRLSPGGTWVSHLLQRLVLALLEDMEVIDLLADARTAYAHRSQMLVEALARHRIATASQPDGLNVWIEFDGPVAHLVTRLQRLGWLVRPGEPFLADEKRRRNAIRVTTSMLDRQTADNFADDLVLACGELGLHNPAQ